MKTMVGVTFVYMAAKIAKKNGKYCYFVANN